MVLKWGNGGKEYGISVKINKFWKSNVHQCDYDK